MEFSRNFKPLDTEAVKTQIMLEGSQADNKAEELSRLKKEKEDIDKDQERAIITHKIKALEIENFSSEQNRLARKEYATKTFYLTCTWGTLIFVILFLIGFKKTGFELSEKVLITLISTTTINFIGFFVLVMKYLFNTNKEEVSKNKVT